MIITTYDVTVTTVNLLSSHADVNAFVDYIIEQNKANEFLMLHHDAEGHLNKYNELYGSAKHLLDVIDGVVEKSAPHLSHSFDTTHNIFSARQTTFSITVDKLKIFLNKIAPIHTEAEELFRKVDHIKTVMYQKLEAADLMIESHNMSSGSSPNPSELEDYIDTSSYQQDDSMFDSYMQ